MEGIEKKRMKLFDWLVGSVVAFEAEVWGWREWGKVEGIQEKYIRWVLGLDRRTPGCMVREERKRKKMRTRLGRRTMGYEKKLEKGGKSEWARKC